MAKRSSLTKRRLIEASGRNMFYWVAGASIVLAFALVALQFIFQDFMFNNKIIDAKAKTAQTLNQNLTTADELTKSVNSVVVSDENLAKNRSYNTQDNIGVVIDALPVEATVTSLPAAIQTVIVPRSGVSLVSISTPSELTATEEVTEIKPVESEYSVEVAGNYDAVKAFMQLLERSVRPIHITSIDLTGTDGAMRASITLKTFHQPAIVYQLKDEVIRQ